MRSWLWLAIVVVLSQAPASRAFFHRPSSSSSPRGGSTAVRLDDDDLRTQALRWLDRAQRNSAGGTNAEGGSWETLVVKDGITIETSKSASSDFCVFRSTMVVRCDAERELEDFEHAMVDIHERQQWDPQVVVGRRLLRGAPRTVRGETDDDLSIDLVRYATGPAAGGWIKPRLFTDVQVTRRSATQLLSSSVAWDPEQHAGLRKALEDGTSLERTPNERGMIEATNLPGGCLAVSRLPSNGDDHRRVFSVTAVGFTNPGGWIPSNLVNSQSPKVFHKIFSRYAKHLGGTIVSQQQDLWFK